MADERSPAEEAVLAAAARHALHDEELVAAYAASGLESDAEVSQARALVERCTVCRDLHRDLVAIGGALALESTFRAVAPRDFRLTVEDAHRLGGRVVTRGFLGSVRRSLVQFARPVGATLATFGLIGVLVGSASLSGGAASSPLAVGSGAGATNAPAEIQSTGTDFDGPKATSGDNAFGPLATGEGTNIGDGGKRDVAAPAANNPVVWLLTGSVAMLLAGIALLVLAVRRGRRGSSGT